MARASTLVFAFVTLTAGLLTAQTRSSIDHSQRDKLNYFVGTWTVEVNMSNGAFGSRLFLSKKQNEWIPNGSLLVSRQEGEGDIGGGGLAVLGYNTHKNEYTYHVVKNAGKPKT